MSLIDKIKAKGAKMAVGSISSFLTPELLAQVMLKIAEVVQASEAAQGKHFVLLAEILPTGEPAVYVYSRDAAKQMHFEKKVDLPNIISEFLPLIQNGSISINQSDLAAVGEPAAAE